MFNEILQYYQSTIDINDIALSKNKTLWKLFWTLFFVTAIQIYLNFEVLQNRYFGFSVTLILITVLLFISVFRKFKVAFIKLAKSNLELDITSFSSCKNFVFDAKVKKLMFYLESKKLNKGDKIKLLIEAANKEIDKKKYPQFFIPGLFLAMFIPVWAQFVKVTYESNQGFGEAFKTTILFIIFIAVSVFLIGTFKVMFSDTKQLLLGDDTQKLKDLIRILEDALLRIDEDNNKNVSPASLVSAYEHNCKLKSRDCDPGVKILKVLSNRK